MISRLRNRAPSRDRHAVRHAVARGRVAARADGGRRPRHLRGEVPRARARARKALVAEVIAGELARGLGLPVPALVTVELDPVLAANEPDEEVQDLLRASPGRNLGVDFLPGALDLDTGRVHASTRRSPARCCGSTRSSATSTGRGAIRTCCSGTAPVPDRPRRRPDLSPQLAGGSRSVPGRPYDAGEHALLGCRPRSRPPARIAPRSTA